MWLGAIESAKSAASLNTVNSRIIVRTSNTNSPTIPDRAVFGTAETAPEHVAALLRFRKRKFVDTLGWPLRCKDAMEADEFDLSTTLYCGLYEGDSVVGGFRAIRTDYPYLASLKFPELANELPYPRSQRSWEISRLGVLSGASGFGRSLACYAAMFAFANAVNAYSLVAFCDVGHERLLSRLGVKTRRFGEPQLIGSDEVGRPIKAVAGEIVLADQDAKRLRLLTAPVNAMEIEDAAAVFGRRRLSA